MISLKGDQALCNDIIFSSPVFPALLTFLFISSLTENKRFINKHSFLIHVRNELHVLLSLRVFQRVCMRLHKYYEIAWYILYQIKFNLRKCWWSFCYLFWADWSFSGCCRYFSGTFSSLLGLRRLSVCCLLLNWNRKIG